MILDWDKVEIYVKPGSTDMRKQINSLAEIVEKEMGKNAGSGELFLFCGRDRKRLKILYYDKNGFCLWLKRLEKHKFPWPSSVEESMKISYEQITMLLDGIDFFNAHTEVRYEQVS